jgi:hypothetical protein
MTLPYHCAKLHLDTMRPPCEAKIVQAEALMAKSPNAMIGALEHCLNCKGQNLQVRPAKEQQMEPMPSPMAADITPIRRENEPPVAAAPRCPKHPAEPQVACGPDSKRAGQYLGACKICMAERRTGREKKLDTKQMTPAVARDFGVAPVVMRALPPDKIAAGRAAVTRMVESRDKAREAARQSSEPVAPEATVKDNLTVQLPPPDLACKNHPDRLAKIDSLGRNMRICNECMAERGQRSAQANRDSGVTGAPFFIPLNAGKWAELKSWLEEQAGENERTLQQEIMFRLKLAMRADNGDVK